LRAWAFFFALETETSWNRKAMRSQRSRGGGRESAAAFHAHSGALAASALMGMVAAPVREGAWQRGPSAGKKPNCASASCRSPTARPIAVAVAQGFDRKYGLQVVPVKQPSWAAVRDGLLNGDLDAATCSLRIGLNGVHMAFAGLQRDMAVLMTSIKTARASTPLQQAARPGVTDGQALAGYVRSHPGELGFAQTFPTDHAMWLYYWLPAHGVPSVSRLWHTVIPPPQMVARLRAGFIDGCCVGEPWNGARCTKKWGSPSPRSRRSGPSSGKVLVPLATFVERIAQCAGPGHRRCWSLPFHHRRQSPSGG